MLIGLKEEDRLLIKEIVTTFKKLGEDMNRNLIRLNENIEMLNGKSKRK